MSKRRAHQPSLQADEAAFQDRVEDFAKKAGWLVQHSYRGRVGGGAWRTPATPGFPDLLLLRPGRCVVLELKMPGNHASDLQNRWVATFQTVEGIEAFVVWPADWPAIMELLTEELPPPPPQRPPR